MRVSILTNGPGELWGWVRPVASELRRRGHSISLWILPCQFSSGNEREAASTFFVDKLQGPAPASVIWNEIADEKTDSIIQLGGDVAFGLRMSKMSQAPLTVYSYRHKKDIPGVNLLTAYHEQLNGTHAKVIGDLVKDSMCSELTPLSKKNWDWPKISGSPRILLLPGSRPRIRNAVVAWLKRLQREILRLIPDARFRALLPEFMSDREVREWSEKSPELDPVRISAGSAMIEADYAVTQPGTNNFEMMHAGLPGVVVAPDEFIAEIPVSGVAGILAGLPLIGVKIRRFALVNLVKKWNGFISLPNRTFQRNILSEMWGDVTPEMIAQRVKSDIDDAEKLKAVRAELLSLSGDYGAAAKICDIATGTGDAI